MTGSRLPGHIFVIFLPHPAAAVFIPDMSAFEETSTLEHEEEDIMAAQPRTMVSATDEDEDCQCGAGRKARQPQPRA